MSFKSKLNLQAKIFNPAERKRAFSNLPMRSAREMKNSLRKKQLDSKPSGRVESYKGDQSRGRGFRRRFQRSAPGQRPANETTTLNSAFTATKTGDNSAIVEIADKINPKTGKSAKDYGARLQNKMNRQVMTKQDVKEAEQDFVARSKTALRDLVK